MQNKGVIRLIAILLALASLYQLSFSVVTSGVKKDAAQFAAGDPNKEAKYLDSMGNEVVYNFFFIRKYTYKECLERELNFGLDLKGGMNVILEVSVADVINALSNNSKDPVFLQAMQLAKEKQKNSQDDFITLFGKSFEEVSPNGALASIFSTLQLKDKVSPRSSNSDVLAVLKDECNAAIENSFRVLRTRIDRFGVTQPNIQQLSGETGRILVELPGVKDPERVKKLLQGTANLEFWETYDVKELWSSITNANQKLKSLSDAEAKLQDNNENAQEGDQEDGETSLLENLDSTSSLVSDTAAIDQTNQTFEQNSQCRNIKYQPGPSPKAFFETIINNFFHILIS